MHLSSLLSTALLLASTATACPPSIPAKRANSSSPYPYQVNGTDAGADPATVGYSLNHLCLNVRDTEASVNFYSSVFGMRKLFTFHVSEHYSITYMAHSHGGKNGTGYQTNDALIYEKNNSEGLLELISIDVPNNALPPSTEVANTFSHIGMVVPDIQALQARLDTFPNVTVLKRYDEELSLYSKISTATSMSAKMIAQLSEEEQRAIEGVMVPFMKSFIVVADPDGNMVEIQSQG